MSSIEFVQSSKSKTILVVDGYEYYKKKENKLTLRWKAYYWNWHFDVQIIVSGSHPRLWRTLEKLKKDAVAQKYLYLQSTAEMEF